MKKTLISCIAAALAVFMVGCDKLPSVEKMTAISTLVGKTAGYACELAKTKTEVKNAIMTVLDVAVKVTPEEGKTFTETLAPVIDEELKKLVDAGKLKSDDAAIAKIALKTATEGIDYIFVKYPKAREVKELVSAAIEGFVAGYKSVVTLAANAEKPEIDEEAYSYLKSKLAK